MSIDSTPPEGADEARREQAAGVADQDLGFELPVPAVLTVRRAIAVGLFSALVLVGAFLAAFLPNRRARAALEASARSAERAVLRVEVLVPRVGAEMRALVLPGSVRPLEETVVYSRANGYLRRWVVDLGDHVEQDQLLAELETPELDQEIAQARADIAQAEARVVQAEASNAFARSDLRRYEQLAPAGIASRADLDQRQAAATVGVSNVDVARAAVVSQRANLQRLLRMKSFARVLAPFAGTVTARMVDRGALVTAGAATPMFRIAANDPARVFLQVPQDVAPSVRAGVAARVTVREYAGRVFEGQVTRSAGSLDPATRTMNTEIRVPNPDGALLAGMYAEVSLSLPLPHRVFELPATALLSDASGLHVATVTDAGTIHLVPVVVERDTGATVQISTGLTGTERVVRLATAGMLEGMPIDAVSASTGSQRAR